MLVYLLTLFLALGSYGGPGRPEQSIYEDHIHNVFGEFRDIKNLHLNLDHQTRFVEGYALVDMKTLKKHRKL